MKEPQLTVVDEFQVVGIETVTSDEREEMFSQARLGMLWSTFFSEKVEEKIPNRKNDQEYFGVYGDYDMEPTSDTYGQYTVDACCEVLKIDEVPDGMVGISVPSGNYLVFEFQGDMADVAKQAWNDIMDFFEGNKTYSRAFTTDFEIYRKDKPGEVRIFVAVQ